MVLGQTPSTPRLQKPATNVYNCLLLSAKQTAEGGSRLLRITSRISLLILSTGKVLAFALVDGMVLVKWLGALATVMVV